MAFEDEYRVYREAIASAIRTFRLRVDVAVAGLGTLETELLRFDPHLVICSRPGIPDHGDRHAWFELSTDPKRLSCICLDGKRSEVANPSLEELFRVIDETERFVSTKSGLGNR